MIKTPIPSSTGTPKIATDELHSLHKKVTEIKRPVLHAINFRNTENEWANALPMGNGHMGAMAFFRDNALILALNHYDVYYTNNEDMQEGKYTGPLAEEFRKMADATAVDPKTQPFCDHGSDPETFRHKKGSDFEGRSLPVTGNLRLMFSDELQNAESLLQLRMEDAEVRLQLQKAGDLLEVTTCTAREDCQILRVTASKPGLMTALCLEFPPCRISEAPDVTYHVIDCQTFAYTARYTAKAKPFVYTGILRLCGASGILIETAGGARIALTYTDKSFTVMTGVFTQHRHPDPLTDGLAAMQNWSIEKLLKAHADHWKAFWCRGQVTLPDKFLERLWYVSLYALECCSGRDSVLAHQACGLNGLWDIKKPTLWGSRWYWDVNIQAAFAGVFSSDHLELGNVFCDALLHYQPMAERFAQEFYGMNGCALDYPFALYQCVWPWCAQYLWAQYEYSGDLEVLRKYYPLFAKLCRMALILLQEQNGRYSVYPDKSPEQGPYSHNVLITTASVKYLFSFTLRATELLGENAPFLEECRRRLPLLADYPIAEGGRYGRHFRDSDAAPDELFLRHPSVLMPIWPIGEIDAQSNSKNRETAMNTLRYVEENCELGVFQGGWCSTAAARLGKGQTALRLLYEKGIDHVIRSNGLAAEETERYVNYCLCMRPPLYYPCMTEFGGQLVAAINEMLLQSHGDVIRVFPSLPNGDPEIERRIGRSLHGEEDLYATYNAWHDVRFDGLLARGAFRVSAEVKDDTLAWITIHSRCGGTARVTSPLLTPDMSVWCNKTPVSFTREGGILRFETATVADYVIAVRPDAVTPQTDGDYDTEVLRHTTYTHRHVYLGEDENTDFERKIDGFVRDYQFSNARHSHRTVYKFDFGTGTEKTYPLFRQTLASDPAGVVIGMAFRQLGAEAFTPQTGYGFADGNGIACIDRGLPDDLRRDFVTSTQNTEFCIELPCGLYDLLFVSGDAAAPGATFIEAPNGARIGNIIPAGQFSTMILPIAHEQDGMLRLKISTQPGQAWKLNLMFVNLRQML